MILVRKVICSRLLPDLWQRIECHATRSPVAKRWSGQPFQRLMHIRETLEAQIKLLARTCLSLNQDVVYVLLGAEEDFVTSPPCSAAGSPQELQILLHHGYPAWWQHEGVLALLEASRTIAAKDSEDEIADMMTSTTFKSSPGADRSKEELLANVGVNRLWEYFSDAVADAVCLDEEKPSDVRWAEIRRANYADTDEDDVLFDELDK
jgi:hypothetical protein